MRTRHEIAQVPVQIPVTLGADLPVRLPAAAGVYRWCVVCACVLALSGCTTTTETRSGRSETQIEHKPTADGGYVERRVTYDSSETAIRSQSDTDWGALGTKAVSSAATGDWAALGGVLGTAAIAGVGGWMQSRNHRARLDETKADRDEGWQKYEAAMKDKANG